MRYFDLSTRKNMETIDDILRIYHFKKMPTGTTEEQWRDYHDKMIIHKMRCDAKRPNPKNYANDEVFKSAYSAWEMMSSCDAPNRPGYYRANND